MIFYKKHKIFFVFFDININKYIINNNKYNISINNNNINNK